MQLVAYGAQDIYLTGNPQITFFKVVYRRHTNFSMEAIMQTWNGNSGVEAAVTNSTKRCTATISRNGDLVHRMYIEMHGTPVAVENPTAYGIVGAELEIGGQKIDKHTGQWMNVWAHLTEPNPGCHVGTCDGDSTAGTLFQRMSGMGGCLGDTHAGSIYYVPLYFWFNRNPGLALPLIALQYHEVKVILEHNWQAAFTAITKQQLWCDYIYLDTDERRRFAQVSHEYLIEQVQEQVITTGIATSDLNFNHPVKELVFCVGGSCRDEGGKLTTIGTLGSPGTYQLKLNGHDRFAARDHTYFSRVRVWEHHTGPGGLLPIVGAASAGVEGATGQGTDGIGVYSFALKPEEHQPSGTCNFSRIDNAQWVGNAAACLATHCYAVNYNVLRIMSGMGGLAYSN